MMPGVAIDPLAGLQRNTRSAVYGELRDRMPVYRSTVHPAWIVTRYNDVINVLRHPEAVAVDAARLLRPLAQRAGVDLSNLLTFCNTFSAFTRPPIHGAVRKLLAQAVAAIRSPALPASLEIRAELLLTTCQKDGSIDIAVQYAQALSLFVVGTFFCIPEADLIELRKLATGLFDIFEFTVPSVKNLLRLNHYAKKLTDYFKGLIASRRANPGSDGISLVTKLADDQLHLNDEEIAVYCLQLFYTAGVETGGAITAVVLSLLECPALSAKLRADTSLTPRAVLEALRIDTPVQFVLRQLPSDCVIAGQVIRSGEPMLLMLGAANLDPAAFPSPHEIMLCRTEPQPLVFAAGAHSCVGMQLAMLEAEVAVRKLLDWPSLRLSREPPIWSGRRNVAPLERLLAIYA